MLSKARNLTIRNITWLTAIILLLSLVVTRGTDEFGTMTSVPPPAVIGYSNSPSWWPWIIVDEQGLLKKHNINAELKWYDNYSDSVKDLNNGFIDANSQMLEDTVASSPKAIKGKVGVLLNSYSNGEDKLIVRQGITKIEDLKGKKIIAEFATLNNPLLSLILASGESDISIDELEIVNLETGSASAAFAVNDEIDGVVSFPPYSSMALTRTGSYELITSEVFPQKIARMLVVTEDIFNNRSKLVKELAEVWFQALNYLQQHPEKANQIIAGRIGVEQNQLQVFQAQIQMLPPDQAAVSKALANSIKNPLN